MHTVYLNNQQYTAQNVNASLVVAFLSAILLIRFLVKSKLAGTLTWQNVLGRVVLTIYAVLVAFLTLTFYRWPSFGTYIDVIKGYGGLGQYEFWRLSVFHPEGVAFSWYQMLANISLFIPLGLLAPLVLPKWRGFFKMLPKIFLTSLIIETIQGISTFFYLSNRLFDANDLVTNTTGGVIGYILYKLVVRYIRIEEQRFSQGKHFKEKQDESDF